jgi:uncharacterized DUF497 family protein
VETVIFGDFEWDADKARVNLEKHGVSFEEAASVFLDLDLVLTDDPKEPGRFIAIGFSSQAAALCGAHRTGHPRPNHQRSPGHSHGSTKL